MRGKMKIWLEKPAKNISNLMSGKNEKARRGVLHEKLRLDLLGVFTVSLYIFKIHFYQLWCHDFENNSSNHIPNYIKQPIKVFENKNKNCNFFI